MCISPPQRLHIASNKGPTHIVSAYHALLHAQPWIPISTISPSQSNSLVKPHIRFREKNINRRKKTQEVFPSREKRAKLVKGFSEAYKQNRLQVRSHVPSPYQSPSKLCLQNGFYTHSIKRSVTLSTLLNFETEAVTVCANRPLSPGDDSQVHCSQKKRTTSVSASTFA